MNNNPLADIVEKAKQCKIENELAEIKTSLNLLLEEQKVMSHFVEVTSFDGKIIAVNPEYVVAICDAEDGIKTGGTIVYHDGATLYTKESREMLTALLNGCPKKTTIG